LEKARKEENGEKSNDFLCFLGF
jgi:hypothetical protein